jgi:hypothetical protein
MRIVLILSCLLYSNISHLQISGQNNAQNSSVNGNLEIREETIITYPDSSSFDQNNDIDKSLMEPPAVDNYSIKPSSSNNKGSETKYKSINNIELNNETEDLSVVSTLITFDKKVRRKSYRKSPTVEEQNYLSQLVKQLGNSNKASFEYNYYNYILSNYNVDSIHFLKQAEKIKPYNADVQIQMAAYHLIKKNHDSASIYLNHLVESSRIDSVAICYAEDLLVSVPQKGVLVTHGVDDTYAIAYLQHYLFERRDILLIPLDFLQSEFFRNGLKKNGFILPDNNEIDCNYLNEFCALNASKNIYLSLTIPKDYFLQIKSNLYTEGLTFGYSKDGNLSTDSNEALFIQMNKKLIFNSVDEKAKQLSANYLPMLLELKREYMADNANVELEAIDKMIIQIAIQADKYEQLLKTQK